MNTDFTRYLWCIFLITSVSTVTLTAAQCSMTGGITQRITHHPETSDGVALVRG